MDSPSAKYFFFHQLKAEFVTYEVGDETDRMLIAERAQTAAYAMMELLLLEWNILHKSLGHIREEGTLIPRYGNSGQELGMSLK